MTLESSLTFSLALLVWVAIPGPAILAIVARSLTKGLRPALRLIVGIMLGDLFYISIVLLGMAAAGQALGRFFVVVRLLGAAYLVYLGLRLWLKNPQPVRADQVQDTDRYKSFLTGFSLTLGNPKAILFHLGFLPTFFDLSRIGPLDALLIILNFLVILGTSLTLYALAASRARRFFGEGRKLRLLNRGAGTLMIGAGIAVAVKR